MLPGTILGEGDVLVMFVCAVTSSAMYVSIDRKKMEEKQRGSMIGVIFENLEEKSGRMT